MLSARVPFAAFRSNLSSGFDCWVHSHTGCEPVTSTRGLCHGKKSEQAGCIASAQPSWLGPTYKEVSRSARVPFSTIYPFGGLSTICPFGGLSCMVRSHAVKVPITLSNELPAGLGLRSANSSSLVGRNLAFGRGCNLTFGRYELIELIMAFGHNELIEFTLAFGRNHKKLIEPNDISLSNQLIVEYSDNLLTQSCPSTFQLIVASVIWLPNATLACAKSISRTAQANQIGFLDFTASLLSNQILRELSMMLLWILQSAVIVVVIVVIVVAAVVGHRRCRYRLCRHAQSLS
jgi:hypothetical protein